MARAIRLGQAVAADETLNQAGTSCVRTAGPRCDPAHQVQLKPGKPETGRCCPETKAPPENRPDTLTVVTRKILVNGRPVEVSPGADVVEVEPGVYSVLLNGRSFEVRADRGAMVVDGQRYEAEVDDPRALKKRHAGAAAEGQQTLKASMPGKIVRVLVAEGDEVAPGQGIIVVEAMKMQNEVKSPKAGVVVSVRVREGNAVTAGDVLAVVG
jgi:biotin carboxyl carrier protein